MPAEAKRYIANNNVNVYLIDAIDLAREIGMGKRTNTVLQSAFFTLANILPAEDALRYMKDAATQSYMKKGQDVVDMNHRAIDAGATAFVKSRFPAAGPMPRMTPRSSSRGPVRYRPAGQEHAEPIGRMDGDSLPVPRSSITPTASLSWALPHTRSAASPCAFRSGTPTKCIQCNQCAFVCPHATIRPFAMTEEEAAAAPEAHARSTPWAPRPKGMKFTMAVSPLDCMGCTNCVKVCPGALEMVRASRRWTSSPFGTTWSRTVSDKELIAGQRQGQPVQAALPGVLGFLRRLCRDRLCTSGDPGRRRPHVHLQRHRLLLHLGQPAATAPYCKDKDGHGPAWNNSLFEDNAEHGLGMAVGYEAVQHKLIADSAVIAADGPSDELKAAGQAWIDSVNAPRPPRPLPLPDVAELRSAAATLPRQSSPTRSTCTKKSFWIFGGDGWAYDIGFGGLDHVLASGDTSTSSSSTPRSTPTPAVRPPRPRTWARSLSLPLPVR